jgi:hypothetical protein
MCRLYAMKIFDIGELLWISTNFAVLQDAITETNTLMPLDTANATIQDTAQAMARKKQAMDAGAQIVRHLQQHASTDKGLKIDRVTVAFAAAYLLHYLTAVPHMDAMVADAMIPRLIVDIAAAHTRRERGDAGRLFLKRYDTTGAFLSNLMTRKVARAKRPTKWKLGGSNAPDIAITRTTLVTLRAMSPIVSARIGTVYENYRAFHAANEHENPFEQQGSMLGYYCAGSPLYNIHYPEAMGEMARCRMLWPAPPCGFGAHVLPLAVYADVGLQSSVNRMSVLIRRICLSDVEVGEAIAPYLAQPGRQVQCLRYHSALFLLCLENIGHGIRTYLEAKGDEGPVIRAEMITKINSIGSNMVPFADNNWFDITTANSAYDAEYLRTRVEILLGHIRSLNHVT